MAVFLSGYNVSYLCDLMVRWVGYEILKLRSIQNDLFTEYLNLYYCRHMFLKKRKNFMFIIVRLQFFLTQCNWRDTRWELLFLNYILRHCCSSITLHLYSGNTLIVTIQTVYLDQLSTMELITKSTCILVSYCFQTGCQIS
jgi:hypothetical protein